MKLSSICLVFSLSFGSVECFQLPKAPIPSKDTSPRTDATALANDLTRYGTTLVAATTIFTSSLLSGVAAAPQAQAAELELSKGAIVVETTTKPGQTLVKAEVDSQSLIKTLFKNRKEFGNSLDRLQQAIQDELKQPVWLELQKELLDIEGDVLPTFKVSAPSDVTVTLKDLTRGRLNLLVNGEVINVVVEPSFGTDEDDLVIRITGFKGEKLTFPGRSGSSTPSYGPLRSWLSQFDAFWSFWNAPYPSKYLPRGVEASNGQIILAGAFGSVGLTYFLSYSYYMQQLEEEEALAASKKEALAEKAKQKKKTPATKSAGKSIEGTVEVTASENVEQAQPLEKKEKPPVNQEETPDTKAVAAKSETNQGESSTSKRKRRLRLRFWKKD